MRQLCDEWAVEEPEVPHMIDVACCVAGSCLWRPVLIPFYFGAKINPQHMESLDEFG
jgi:hypothetical protein